MLYALSYVEHKSILTHNGREIVKIGFTDNLGNRLSHYRHLRDEPLVLFGTVSGCRNVENFIHRCLSNDFERVFNQTYSEWYYLTDELKQCIQFLFRSHLDWTPIPFITPKKGRDQHPAVVKTVKWLETNLITSGDLVEFDDLMNELGLPEKERKTVKNALRPSALAKKGLGIILKDLGVSIRSKGGRAAYFRLCKD